MGSAADRRPAERAWRPSCCGRFSSAGAPRRFRKAQITYLDGQRCPRERAYERVGFVDVDRKRDPQFEAIFGATGTTRMWMDLSTDGPIEDWATEARRCRPGSTSHARDCDRRGNRSVPGESIGELLAPVDVVPARLCGDVRGHGALCLLPGCLLETSETLRAGHRALRRRLTLERRLRPRFAPKKGGTDSQPSACPSSCHKVRGPRDALLRPAGARLSAKRVRRTSERVVQDVQDIRPDAEEALVTTKSAFLLAADALVGPERVRPDAEDALAVAKSVLRAAAGAFVATECLLLVAGRALVSLEDVLVAWVRVLFDGKRVRRTSECVLQAVQDIRPDAEDALVTTESAFLLTADALVGPERVRPDAEDALAVAKSVLRAAAGAFVATECLLLVAGRALVSLEDVLVAWVRVLFDGKRVRRTSECVLQAVQDIRPDAEDALVTTESASSWRNDHSG